jgi:hypothetical protein
MRRIALRTLAFDECQPFEYVILLRQGVGFPGNPTGSALSYSTYLGGNGGDGGDGIALDPSGNVYVSGSTSSGDFPVTAGSFDTTFNGIRRHLHSENERPLHADQYLHPSLRGDKQQ